MTQRISESITSPITKNKRDRRRQLRVGVALRRDLQHTAQTPRDVPRASDGVHRALREASYDDMLLEPVQD